MGQKGKPKKNASTNLGRSIIRQQFAAAGTLSAEDAQLLETERGKHKLRSVTQCDDLEELMSSAILSGTDFTSKRGEVIVLGQEVHAVLHAEGKTEAPVDIPIPRRPAWQAQQTAVELDRNEGAAFVAWRSKMAEIEEQQGSLLTPFEKNLEVWRQLWRVLERSQLVVQIVDARNPLLFRSADLERYAHELDPRKRCMLLVNKADLLTLAQRRSWAAYFKKLNVEFVFWSAFNAQLELEEEARQIRQAASRQFAMRGGGGGAKRQGGSVQGKEWSSKAAASMVADVMGEGEEEEEEEAAGKGAAAAVAEEEEDEEESDDDDEDAALARLLGSAKAKPKGVMDTAAARTAEEEAEDDDDDDDDDEDEEDEEDDDEALRAAWGQKAAASAAGASGAAAAEEEEDEVRVYGRDELLALLMRRCPAGAAQPDGSWAHTIGLVGYPNVGKSSTVNVLVAEKKTCVSATPGKTKHFQTLRVPDEPDLLLCDCPGLVFPTVAGSKAQMICDGILPADTMRDHMPPVRLLFSRLTPADFFHTYGVRLMTEEERGEDPEATEPARELLMSHALSRGFMTASVSSTPDEARSARMIVKDLVNAKLLYCTPPPGLGAEDYAGRTERITDRKPLRNPTSQRYIAGVQAIFDAQKEVGGHLNGRKTGHETKRTGDNVTWRPGGLGLGGAALPDRMVARGPRVL